MFPVDVGALFRSIMEKFTPQAQKAGVRLGVDVPGDLPSITGDGDRLAQVFTNLVDNALKFSPPGSTVHLRVADSDDPLALVKDGAQVREAGQGDEVVILQSNLPQAVKLHYAMKANPMPALVGLMAAVVFIISCMPIPVPTAGGSS